jgi:peptidoglycan/LPS O-acetylase OafA/YrhL
MIDPRTRVAMFILGLLVLAFVINMVRTRMLQERYALLWLLAAAGLTLAPLFIHGIDRLAYALGVAYPPALLLALAVIALMLIILQLSLSISRQADHIKVLMQELGLLRQELDSLARHEHPERISQGAQSKDDGEVQP